MTPHAVKKAVALAVCALFWSGMPARAQGSVKDLDVLNIIDVGPIDIGPCGCLDKAFTLPLFPLDQRHGHGPTVPFRSHAPGRDRLAMAADAAELATHVGDSINRAFMGDPFEAFHIAWVIAAAVGVKPDEANALSWFVLAAVNGHPQAPVLAGYRFLRGIGVKADPFAAAGWFRVGAERGDRQALIALGLLHATGQGVLVDFAEALRLWDRAGSSPFAQRFVADAHACGLGVGQNLKRAAEIYQRIADEYRYRDDQSGARVQLARMRRDGCGIERDGAEALKLFEEGSNSGNPEAQIELSEMLLAGDGGESLPRPAYAWASIAALRLPAGRLRDRAEKARGAAARSLDASAKRETDALVAATLEGGRRPPPKQ